MPWSPGALGVERVLAADAGSLFERDVDAVGDVGTLLVERHEIPQLRPSKPMAPSS